MEKYPITVKLISDVNGELCFDAYCGEDETSSRIAKVKVALTPTLNYKEFAWDPQFSDCGWFMGEVYRQIVDLVHKRNRELEIKEWEERNGKTWFYTIPEDDILPGALVTKALREIEDKDLCKDYPPYLDMPKPYPIKDENE